MQFLAQQQARCAYLAVIQEVIQQILVPFVDDGHQVLGRGTRPRYQGQVTAARTSVWHAGYAQGTSRRVCRCLCLCHFRGMHRACIEYATCVTAAAASTTASTTDRFMHMARTGHNYREPAVYR
jgi:hypothetical protein